ncbi:protein of unknown function [Burkholderia multivorans]
MRTMGAGAGRRIEIEGAAAFMRWFYLMRLLTTGEAYEISTSACSVADRAAAGARYVLRLQEGIDFRGEGDLCESFAWEAG